MDHKQQYFKFMQWEIRQEMQFYPQEMQDFTQFKRQGA
jgi:hypothetical protein